MTQPIRVLELRSADGAGGGPEKTILHGAALADPTQLQVTVCYIRNLRDTDTHIQNKALKLGLDYVEIRERNPFHPGNYRQAEKLVRCRHINLVHSHDYKSDLFAWRLARTMGVIPLSTAHGWTGNSWRETWLYYPVGRALLRQFPGVIAVSSDIQRELVRAGVKSDRIRTIVNGIDQHLYRRNPDLCSASRERLGVNATDVVIGSVGRLESQKRFDILIRAMMRLLQKFPALKLVIAGEGSLRRDLETLIRELGLSQRCRLIGHQSDMIGYYHAIDLFVQASDYEGTPNVVLEAMALGVPVVATDVGGTGQLIEHEKDGLLVTPGDIDALANEIERVFSFPESTLKRSESARRRVEGELSFERRQQSMESFYIDLIRLKQSRPGKSPQTRSVTTTYPERPIVHDRLSR